jgi:two-component system sensor histidine kinase/response regulator
MEFRNKIFEKFGAMELRNNRKYHSVGLGLAFCKLAIQAHKGAIGVASNEPRGSIFWFEIPNEIQPAE